MLSLLLFAAVAADEMTKVPGPHGVRLIDAREFGVHPKSAEGLWRLARDHSGLMRERMQVENSRATLWAWEQECAWRTEVFDQLDNVLRCPMGYQAKMKCLARVKAMIGDVRRGEWRLVDPKRGQ